MHVSHHRHFPAVHERGATRLLVLALFMILIGSGLFFLQGYTGAFFSINGLGPLAPSGLWETLTLTGDVMTLCALLLFAARRFPQVVWAATLGLVMSLVIVRIAKLSFSTARPPGALDPELLYSTGPAWVAHSFPSGHTLAAALVTGIWIYYTRRFWSVLPAVLFICAVGASRVIVGVHWPVDTLFGAALGMLCAWFGIVGARNWDWGLRRTGHTVVVVLLTLASAGLFIEDGGYTHGILPVRLLAAAAIVYGLYELLVHPESALSLRRPRAVVSPT